MKSRASEAARLGPVLDFMRVVWDLDHGLQSASKRMEARLGVTGPQRLVVRLVGRFPGSSAGRLAELLCIHPSTLTGILQRLVARGHLVRRRDPEDGRRALFDLTARGRQIDEMREGTVEAKLRRVLAGLDARTLQATRETLTAITAALASDD